MSNEPHSMLTAFCAGLFLSTMSGNMYMSIPTALCIYLGPDLLVSGATDLLTIARLRLCPPPKPKKRRQMAPPKMANLLPKSTAGLSTKTTKSTEPTKEQPTEGESTCTL